MPTLGIRAASAISRGDSSLACRSSSRLSIQWAPRGWFAKSGLSSGGFSSLLIPQPAEVERGMALVCRYIEKSVGEWTFLLGGYNGIPPPPGFSQVFILKVVKVLCFDTLLQVFILKAVSTSIRSRFLRRSFAGSATSANKESKVS